ncbi:MAG: hypothetical protein U9Q20_04685 [Campylobacterota bacterium]|nr:hypothetical protein [Campylobacterota bacterium]
MPKLRILIFLMVVVSSNIYGKNINNNWAISLSSSKSLQSAEQFIAKNLKNPNNNIYILKKSSWYIVAYGAFDSYMEAKIFSNKQNSIKNFKPYIMNMRYNLEEIDKLPKSFLISYIPYNNQGIFRGKINKYYTTPKVNSNKVTETKTVKQNRYKKRENTHRYNRMRQKNRNKRVNNYTYGNYKYSASLIVSPIEITGDFQLSNTSANLDLINDIGVKENSITLIPSILINRDKHNASFSYFTNTYLATTTLNSDISLNGTDYTTGTDIETNINTSLLSIEYFYNFSFLDFGASLNLYENEISLKSLSDSALPTTKIDGSYLFYNLEVKKIDTIKGFLINYGASIGMGGEVDYLSYYLSAGMKFDYIKDSNISLGYKVMNINIDDNSYKGEFNYDGIYFKFTKIF